MAERILVTPEEMLSTMQVYESKKAEQQNAYLQMSNAVRVLDGSWDGLASEVFKAAFDKLYRNLETSTQAMEKSINALKQGNELFTSTEKNVSTSSEALSAGDPYSV